LQRALPALFARDGALQRPAVVRVHTRVLHGAGDAYVKLAAVDQILGVGCVHREIDPLA
jgi:hypothetical protein